MKTIEQRVSILEKRILKQGKQNRVNETLRYRIQDWEVKPITFSRFEELARRSRSEGIVLLGAGGNTKEWVEGVSEMLFDEGVATTNSPSSLFRGAYILKTSGGRNDLALLFNKPFPADLGRMAMWRLRFGDCSWVSDYVVNYKKQHTNESKATKKRIKESFVQGENDGIFVLEASTSKARLIADIIKDHNNFNYISGLKMKQTHTNVWEFIYNSEMIDSEEVYDTIIDALEDGGAQGDAGDFYLNEE